MALLIKKDFGYGVSLDAYCRVARAEVDITNAMMKCQLFFYASKEAREIEKKRQGANEKIRSPLVKLLERQTMHIPLSKLNISSFTSNNCLKAVYDYLKKNDNNFKDEEVS